MKLKKIIFLAFFILTTVTVLAQPGTPDDGDNTIDLVPIDDHLWIILLLGLGLGIYFILSKKPTSGK